MPVFLLYSNLETDRNATSRDCVIVQAADEPAARAAAALAVPDGETRVPASWVAVNLTTAPPAAPIWVRGRVAEPLRPSAGH